MVNLYKIQTKKINYDNKIYDYLTPSKIYLPITKNDFKIGTYVYKNTKIGDFTTSISGVVNNIQKMSFNNKKNLSLEITNDLKENSKNRLKKSKINSVLDLLSVLDLVNLQSIRDKIKKVENINNLVISSIDEEEEIVNELFYLTYHYDEILNTINELMKIFDLKQSILATKSTNFNSIQNVKSIIGTYPNILINLVPTKYLISYPPFLCKYLNLSSNDTLVLTTKDIYYLSFALNYKHVTEALITISGDIPTSFVVNVKLYTPLKEVLMEFLNPEVLNYNIYLFGYLKKEKIDNLNDVIISNDTNSIVLKKEIEKSTECINCGACLKICPMKINVKKYFFNNKFNKKCLHCGLCNYICPARLDLKRIGVNYEE